MSQGKISSRRGVAHKGIGRVLFLIVAVFGAALFLRSMPTYAESYDHIIIDNAGIRYPDDFPQDTARYNTDTRTLTLSGYDSGLIEIAEMGEPINLVLEGENIITAAYAANSSGKSASISSGTSVNVSGQGTLTLAGNDVDCIGFYIHNDAELTINSGTLRSIEEDIKLIIYGDSVVMNGGEIATVEVGFNAGRLMMNGGKITVDDARFNADFFQMDGGEIDVSGGAQFDVFIMNDGVFNLDNSFDGRGVRIDVAFNQNGGELNISNCYAVGVGNFAVFSGGITSIECEAAGFYVEKDSYTDEISSDLAERIRFPSGEEMLEITGGDITLSGGSIALMLVYELGDDATNYPDIADMVMISSNMTKDPSVDFDVIYLDGYGYYLLPDGSGEIGFDDDDMPTNALTSIHIYEGNIDDGGGSATIDDEEKIEVPNTLDHKIVLLALGLLFSIIAEGVIIADLYRRLFSYEKEIANVDEKSDSISEDNMGKA